MPQSTSSRACRKALRLNAVRDFLEEPGDALINACELLGGSGGRGRAIRLISTVAGAADLPQCVERELGYMHRLLNTPEISNQSESSRRLFANPIMAAAHEDVRLLADALFILLRLLAEDEDGRNPQI